MAQNQSQRAFNFIAWIVEGVHQGFVLRPILFNLYLNNLFCFADTTKICNFADHTMFHACDNDLNNLSKWRLEHDVTEWFESNNIKLNIDKYHL